MCGRASSEVRKLVAAISELQKKNESLANELRETQNRRNYFERCAEDLKSQVKELTPPTLSGRQSKIPKLKEQSTAFYDQAEFICKVMRRYDPSDVPLLITAMTNKLGREHKTDLSFATIVHRHVGHEGSARGAAAWARAKDRQAFERERVHPRPLLTPTVGGQDVQASVRPHRAVHQVPYAHFADGSKRFRAGRRCAVAGSLGPTGGSEGGLLPGLLDKYVISNNYYDPR